MKGLLLSAGFSRNLMNKRINMVKASICTIGDEILIGQIVDTNSSEISKALGSVGVNVNRMLSIGDKKEDILLSLKKELSDNDIVVVTGGLGPTKDDITKDALASLSGSSVYVENKEQLEIIRHILHSRGLDVLEANKAQALVPEKSEVIPNRLGTAPIMIFRLRQQDGRVSTLYAMPGVPFEAMAALPSVIEDIRLHYPLSSICHRNIMTFGLAESALAEKIFPWEKSLPDYLHLAYLPSTLTGVRLRLSIYGCEKEEGEAILEKEILKLKNLLGPLIYSFEDDTLENVLGKILKAKGKTISAAESCTGGKISQMLTNVPGASAYYLGSVTSYHTSVKEKVLNIPSELIKKYGVVSGEVAAAMAEGVRKLTGSDFSVSTTGLAGPGGDIEPEGTLWAGVSSKDRVITRKFQFHGDRKSNIERFSSSALNMLLSFIREELGLS